MKVGQYIWILALLSTENRFIDGSFASLINVYDYTLTNCIGINILTYLFSLTISPGSIKEEICHRDEVGILPDI